jgi:hypothetical protein
VVSVEVKKTCVQEGPAEGAPLSAIRARLDEEMIAMPPYTDASQPVDGCETL